MEPVYCRSTGMFSPKSRADQRNIQPRGSVYPWLVVAPACPTSCAYVWRVDQVTLHVVSEWCAVIMWHALQCNSRLNWWVGTSVNRLNLDPKFQLNHWLSCSVVCLCPGPSVSIHVSYLSKIRVQCDLWHQSQHLPWTSSLMEQRPCIVILLPWKIAKTIS